MMSLRLVGCLGLGVLITIVIAGGVLALRMNGIGAMIERAPATPGTELPQNAITITYRVSGSVATAGVTYQDASDATRDERVSLPWQQAFTVGNGAYVHVTARTDDGAGSLTCEILASGATWRHASGTGEASCGGFAGTQ
ncbi:hypothetical protein [Nitrolancea hollandica]|uniref:MmpS family membrane protein n=1 Tax=Nitrolancea hollandica Lb TaxID=1129897 RepID=I4EIU6_9BACT|nr:hypothetical protein [Nitrolancea hollandica]CCF84608.1 exported hypothetical protein [Nitrolancea hollandica Lb]